jgi:probable blue pigment (indigoidine) exporter
VTAANIGGYAYLSLVGTALAYTVWFRGLERLPAASVSLLGLLSPVVASVLGWAALGQHLTAVQLLGMAVALGGVFAGQARPPAKKADPAGTSYVLPTVLRCPSNAGPPPRSSLSLLTPRR